MALSSCVLMLLALKKDQRKPKTPAELLKKLRMFLFPDDAVVKVLLTFFQFITS